ncbi:MAG: SRPBCC family protein [Kaiparowitsia implicata GSE-PSE-MK54-09C]|jgi:hypothetical protein|nr:SRPBCC family protein [Kaiparowitsia implicata GSE-PSE-MK54-09C]
MKKQTSVVAIASAPADKIWATIAAGGGVHQWFGTVITACELKGAGAGAERFCTMANGAELRERIIEADHDARRFCYAIDQHPLPATDVVATIEVADLGDDKTEIRWGADYTVEEAYLDIVDQTLGSLYAQGIQALEDHCRVLA